MADGAFERAIDLLKQFLAVDAEDIAALDLLGQKWRNGSTLWTAPLTPIKGYWRSTRFIATPSNASPARKRGRAMDRPLMKR